MTITGNCVLYSDISIENSPDCILNEPESSLEFEQTKAKVNKILEVFYNSVDFSPLVSFINKGSVEFEALLKTGEIQQSITEHEQTPNLDKKVPPQRKTKYFLRRKPYQSFQDKSDLSLEDKRQQALDLVYSGVAKAVIEKEFDIPAKTLKEWCRLTSWSGRKDRQAKKIR